MGTVFIDLLKMRVSVCSLPILSIAFGAAAAPILALTAPQVTAIAGLVALAKIKVAGVAGGVLLARHLNSARSSGRRSRGKRSVEEDQLELDVTLKLLTDMEPEHCYKRIICAASTGKYYNQKLDGVMSIINEKASDLRAAKFLAAAQYGQLARDVAKCEHRYQCALDLEIIQTVF